MRSFIIISEQILYCSSTFSHLISFNVNIFIIYKLSDGESILCMLEILECDTKSKFPLLSMLSEQLVHVFVPEKIKFPA